MREETRRTGRDVLAAGALLFVPFWIYGPVTRLYFTNDDPQILVHILTYRPWQYFFVPRIWQEYHRLFFTPLLNFSLQVDLWLSGLHPAFFYRHQLLLLGAIAAVFYALLARFLPRAFAFLGALLFLVGPPVPEMAEQLMVRQYLDGLLLALGAALLYLAGRTFPAAVLYLGAMAAKEVYAPLVLLLVAIPGEALVARLRRAGPLFGALGVYVAWRAFMLPELFRSYDPDTARLGALPRQVAAMGRQIGFALLGNRTTPDWLLLVALGLLVLPVLWSRPRAALFAAWAAALVLVPVLPVAGILGSRYVFVPWLLFAALVAWTAHAYRGRHLGIGAVAIFLLAGPHAWIRNRERWATSFAEAVRQSAEGSFFFSRSAAGDVLRQPAAPAWYFDSLRAIRDRMFPTRGKPADVIWDDVFLLTHPLEGRRFFESRPGAEDLVDVTAAMPAAADAYRARVREAPLEADVTLAHRLFSWRFGPYTSGTYSLVFLIPAARFNLPPAGRHWLPMELPMRFLVRYESPEGWITFSPPLEEPVRDGVASLRWRRG